MRLVRRSFAVALGVLATFAVARGASANGLEIPENGTEIMGRGGAWTARADHALAAALNPAGLAGQKTNVVVNSNLTWASMCFQRAGNYPTGGIASGTNYSSDYEGKPYPRVCKRNNLGDVNVVPQIGFTYAVNDKLGIGILPLWTPSGTGKAIWPDDQLSEDFMGNTRTADGTPAPAPQRFMLLRKDARIIMPTFGVGYELFPGFRVGASFQWVITMFKSSVSSQATQSGEADTKQGAYNSARSDVSWNQYFTPAAVFGFMASPSDDIDIGGMFRWSADIVKRGGDVHITGPYYGKNAADRAETDAKVKEFRIPQPWEFRVGFRYHPKRKGVEVPKGVRRDFMAHDQFDVELDFTYAHNSQFDQLTILFEPGQRVKFGSCNTCGFVPPDASIEKKWKDTIGVRLGGEYVVLPNQLGVRVGGFWQSKGQDEQYLNLDFHPGTMYGFYLGATYRLSQVIDLALGYGHIFVRPFDNTATGGKIRGLTGTEPSSVPGQPAYSICPDAPAYRTCQVVNTGRLTSGYNMFSLGTTLRF